MPGLAETNETGAMKSLSKSVLTKATKLDSQTGWQLYFLNVMNTKNRFSSLAWRDAHFAISIQKWLVSF